MEINHMDIKEFRKEGFLQEVNRQFFHPLGLALEVDIDDETGVEFLGGIWDYRDDPEGIRFNGFSEKNVQNAKKIEKLQKKIAVGRYAALRYVVQPVIANEA